MATRGEAQAAMAPGVSGVVMMTAEEARACVERVRAGIEQMRRDLLELREREGWKALGYPSWRACAVAEFGVSMATVYRQLEAAAIERDLSQVEKNVGRSRPPSSRTPRRRSKVIFLNLRKLWDRSSRIFLDLRNLWDLSQPPSSNRLKTLTPSSAARPGSTRTSWRARASAQRLTSSRPFGHSSPARPPRAGRR